MLDNTGEGNLEVVYIHAYASQGPITAFSVGKKEPQSPVLPSKWQIFSSLYCKRFYFFLAGAGFESQHRRIQKAFPKIKSQNSQCLCMLLLRHRLCLKKQAIIPVKLFVTNDLRWASIYPWHMSFILSQGQAKTSFQPAVKSSTRAWLQISRALITSRETTWLKRQAKRYNAPDSSTGLSAELHSTTPSHQPAKEPRRFWSLFWDFWFCLFQGKRVCLLCFAGKTYLQTFFFLNSVPVSNRSVLTNGGNLSNLRAQEAFLVVTHKQAPVPDRQASISEGFGCSSWGDQTQAQSVQALGKLHQAGLLRDAEQSWKAGRARGWRL